MQTNIPTIITIGKATQDVFLKSDEFDPKLEGRIAYTHLPLGAKLDVEETIFATGGNATNVATTIARQGLHSRYIWTLGVDPASTAIVQELDREGIDTSLVKHREDHFASYSTVLLAPSGERTILNYHGHSMQPGDMHEALGSVEAADWFYPSALGSYELLRGVIDRARHLGASVMLNPATSELEDIPKLKAILEDVDVLCVNREEMSMIVEGNTIEELVRHGLHYCSVVIVSDGPRGVCASDGKTLVNAGMYEDVPVVDRTGAGDAFASGFLSRWARGDSLRESVMFASANSTSVVSRIGAKAGILHQDAELHDMDISEKEL